MRQLLSVSDSISRNSTRASQQCNMPSNLNARLLTAVMLTALLLCARGAPVEVAPTDSLGDEYSGEQEMEPTDEPSKALNFTVLFQHTEKHQSQFTAEFHLPYDRLKDHKLSSIPANCSATKSSKEAVLKSFLEGLQTFRVLLKYVEREYPDHRTGDYILGINQMINEIRGMKILQPFEVLTSNQETQLLGNINNSTDTFQRKMTANGILHGLHNFLKNCIQKYRGSRKV